MKVLFAYDGSECAEQVLDDLRRAGLPTETQVRALAVAEHWLPPPSALEIAEAWGADCIFVGAHGMNRVERCLPFTHSATRLTTSAHPSISLPMQTSCQQVRRRFSPACVSERASTA